MFCDGYSFSSSIGAKFDICLVLFERLDICRLFEKLCSLVEIPAPTPPPELCFDMLLKRLAEKLLVRGRDSRNLG